MGINWEVILWTSITLVLIIGFVGIVFYFISAVNIRKRRDSLEKVHTELHVGSQIIFGGGIYGRVVGIDADTVNVEVSKNTVIKISRYAIQSLLNS